MWVTGGLKGAPTHAVSARPVHAYESQITRVEALPFSGGRIVQVAFAAGDEVLRHWRWL